MTSKKRCQSFDSIKDTGTEPENYASSENAEFEYLICFICEGVFKDPVQCPDEHYFCRDCVTRWIMKDNNHCCPADLAPLHPSELRAAPRILRNIIDALQVKCRYHVFGCQTTINSGSVTTIEDHVSCCDFRWWSLIDHDYNLISVPLEKDSQSVSQGDTKHKKRRRRKQRLEVRPEIQFIQEIAGNAYHSMFIGSQRKYGNNSS